MLYLYTEQFFWWSRVKNFIKILLGRRIRGPQAVEGSLIRGLRELNIPFKLNAPLVEPINVLCLPTGGVRALRWAIQQKRKGLAKKILAGPVIVITPDEGNWLVASPEVDGIVVPSSWVKSFWESFRPELSTKIKIWFSGVKDIGSLVNPNGKVLIFQKNSSEEIYNKVIAELCARGLIYETIRYGFFNQSDYRQALSRCRFMIYLSQSESQSLALHEAWMADVPTLVWNRGFMVYKQQRWEDEAISAPYLDDRFGLFFKDGNEFGSQCDKFLKQYKFFTPRQSSLEQFTDRESVKLYLKIIRELL
ncbi:MAG: hypothetical protein WC794_02040 [Candidatus Doudnabacteria bacterium]|jgi:hypothetical protein